jgi:broad specificity phosphatase PhoE
VNAALGFQHKQLMKTIYLVRHGEAVDDRLEEVSYSPKNEYDKPLTILGISQVQKLAKVFEGVEFDRSFASDYLRAIETFEYSGIKSKVHMELYEIRELYCECIGKNLGNTDLVEFRRQRDRVQRFIDLYLSRIEENEKVVIVAHGCFILYLLKKLTGKSFGHDMTYTGITELTYGHDWEFSYFNSSSHLFESINPEIEGVVSEAPTSA